MRGFYHMKLIVSLRLKTLARNSTCKLGCKYIMEIKYIGHSCFEIKGKELKIVIDPYDPKKTGYKLPKLNADLVLCSHNHDDHSHAEGVSDYTLHVSTPGEYEVKGIYVEAIPTFHDNRKGADRGLNTLFQIHIDGLIVLHAGDLGHELAKETLEQIGDVDVLLLPVGGVYTINAETASKVVAAIEPGIVVPMHYQTDDLTGLSKKLDDLKKFLDEIGDSNVKKVDKLKLLRKSDIPEETEVIVINPSH